MEVLYENSLLKANSKNDYWLNYYCFKHGYKIMVQTYKKKIIISLTFITVIKKNIFLTTCTH